MKAASFLAENVNPHNAPIDQVCTPIKVKHYQPHFVNDFNKKQETITTPWSEIGFHLSTVQRRGWSKVVTFRSFCRREFRKSQKLSTKIIKDRHYSPWHVQSGLSNRTNWATDWLTDWPTKWLANWLTQETFEYWMTTTEAIISICLKGGEKKNKI